MSSSVDPTGSQLERLASSKDDGPVMMLNLLRFKERADGIDAPDGITGAEAYERYGAAVAPFLEQVGGRLALAGAAAESVIGPQDTEWDLVVMVQYPSRRAFLEMIGNPGYLEVHAHRAAAVADSRLIACQPLEL